MNDSYDGCTVYRLILLNWRGKQGLISSRVEIGIRKGKSQIKDNNCLNRYENFWRRPW